MIRAGRSAKLKVDLMSHLETLNQCCGVDMSYMLYMLYMLYMYRFVESLKQVIKGVHYPGVPAVLKQCAASFAPHHCSVKQSPAYGG